MADFQGLLASLSRASQAYLKYGNRTLAWLGRLIAGVETDIPQLGIVSTTSTTTRPYAMVAI